MRRWLRWEALSLWILLYLIIFHTLFTSPLIFFLGLVRSAIVLSFAVGVWSSVFYLLLCQGYKSDKVQRYLAQLREEQERGLPMRIGRQFSRYFSRVKSWFAKQLSEKLLPSPVRVFLIFVGPGPLFGVPAVRAAYSAKVSREALLLIWAGCIVNAFFWTVLARGPLISLVRKLSEILYGGG